MALYMKIPKDLNGIKDTVVFKLTKRQLIFICIGLAAGLSTYWLTYRVLGTTTAATLLFCVVCPFALTGMYQNPNTGFTLEKTLANIIRYNIYPKIRPYKTENIFRQITNEIEYQKEVKMLETGRKEV